MKGGRTKREATGRPFKKGNKYSPGANPVSTAALERVRLDPGIAGRTKNLFNFRTLRDFPNQRMFSAA